MCRGVAATLVALIGAQVTAARPIQKAVVVQQAGAYKGDVTDVRVVRRVESHSDAWRLWQPFIAQWKRKHLVVAFGAMTNSKKDMGDIFASVSRNDGDTWGEPVAIFDHNRCQGTLRFAYANPVLFKPVQTLRGAVKFRPIKGQKLRQMLDGARVEPKLESYIRDAAKSRQGRRWCSFLGQRRAAGAFAQAWRQPAHPQRGHHFVPETSAH